MMINAIKKDFTSRAAAITMALAAVIAPLTATFAADSGEEAAPQNEQTQQENGVQVAANTSSVSREINFTSPNEAGRASIKDAKDNDALNVVVGFGDFEGATPPEVIGEYFANAIKHRGTNSSYVIVHGGNPGYSIRFMSEHTIMGPLSVDDADAAIDRAIREKDNIDDVLAGNYNHDFDN